jgi:hexosaminidase
LKTNDHLRAAAFDPQSNLQMDGSSLDLTMNEQTLYRRYSPELQLCATSPVIGMEQDPPHGARPVSLANYTNPCWIYKQADLSRAHSITATVMSLPYLYSERNAPPPLAPVRTPSGELEVHLDSCSGAVIAYLPFAPAVGRTGAIELNAQLPPQQGSHDLCLKVARSAYNPLWVIDWVQLNAASTTSH